MPTIKDVAKKAGVSTATVSRVLKNHAGVRPQTRERVLDALQKTGYGLLMDKKDEAPPATIKEVADRAGVSTATVSRVLNDETVVRAETRERVLTAIHELGFRPNLLAQQFRRMYTRMVGVIIPDISGPFFARVVKGIENASLRHRYHVVLMEARERKKQFQAINALVERRTDGLLLMTSQLTEEDIQFLEHLPIPVVLISQDYSSPTLPSINIDNEAAAYQMTRYLLGRGYRKIAFLGGPFHDRMAVMNRLNGYSRALREENIPVRPELIREGEFSMRSGYKNCLRLIGDGMIPDAVFAANDDIAIGAIKAFRNHRIMVPKDVAVAGFDDLPLSGYFTPALTTVHQPKYRLGSTGMRLLLEIMQGNKPDQTHILLKHELKIRESA